MEKGISNDYTYEQNSENIKKMLFEHELNSEPDSKFEYSNSNFFLLADILEQITGEKYEAYIRKNFFFGLVNCRKFSLAIYAVNKCTIHLV